MNMKPNYSYIWVSLVILVFGIIFIPRIVERVKNKSVVDADRHAVGNASRNADELVTIGKVPDFEFTNQFGKTVTHDNYRGKVYVAEFFFTSCPTICPVMNKNMVQLQNAFLTTRDFGIASFTIDPEHDTPDVLKAYAERYEVTHSNWHMLTGDKATLFELANTGFNLYVGQNSDAPGGFEHSGMFALIDKEGNIRSRVDGNGNPIVYYDGIEADGIRILKEDIALLLKE